MQQQDPQQDPATNLQQHAVLPQGCDADPNVAAGNAMNVPDDNSSIPSNKLSDYVKGGVVNTRDVPASADGGQHDNGVSCPTSKFVAQYSCGDARVVTQFVNDKKNGTTDLRVMGECRDPRHPRHSKDVSADVQMLRFAADLRVAGFTKVVGTKLSALDNGLSALDNGLPSLGQ